MTYTSPTTGDRVGLSFINPRTREELEARRVMMLNWARTTCGMMGRSPDFMNVTLRRLGRRRGLLRRSGRPEFGAEHPALLRVHPRERHRPDPLADQPAAQPQCLRHVQPRRKAPRCEAISETSRRHRGARRARPGDARPDLRRDRGLFAAARPAHRGPQPVRRSPSRSRAARRGCASSAATASISAARISTIRSARASRRWTASCSSTMWRCRGSGCSCYGDVDAAERRRRTARTIRRIRRIRARRRTSPSANSCSASPC